MQVLNNYNKCSPCAKILLFSINYVFFSLGYISEHMDSKNKLAPLFQAQLELLEPEMVFAPSLDPNDKKGFTAIIKSLIADILKMSKLIERIDPRQSQSYENKIIENEDIIEMKEDILNGIEKVMDSHIN